MKKILIFILCFLVTPFGFSAIFDLTVTVGSDSKTEGYSNVSDVIDAMDTDKIVVNFPTYTGTESLSLLLDFRGLPLMLSFDAASNVLNFSVPDISLSQSFSGTSRENSIDLFEEWLKNGGEYVNQIMKKLVEVSPSDPIAGNPSSLMSKMVGNDFDTGVNDGSSRQETSGGSTNNLMTIGVKFNSYSYQGLRSRMLSIPFKYVVKFDSDPRKKLIINYPITYLEVDEAKSYNMALSFTYKFPVYKTWYLAPSLGTGIVGSIDLGSMGQILSASLTSVFELKNEYFRWGMGNMVGNYRTIEFGVSDYKYDPGISNTVIRNGLFISKAHPVFSFQAESELFFYDTRYYGDALFMDQYNEVGYSIGTDKDRKDVTRLLRLGMSYLFSSKITGFSINFGYSF